MLNAIGYRNAFRTGFTIVELLIVIVVIGILAAISIVAYSGIQNRAKASALSSDLKSSMTALKLFQVDKMSFPVSNDCSAVPVAGSICLKSANTTTYQYTVNNTTSPQSACLTATNGNVSYFITQDKAPAAGACVGHGSGGLAAITNLFNNPSFELSTVGWGSVSRMTFVPSSSNPYSGNTILRQSINAVGYFPRMQSVSIPIAANKTYTLSAWMKSTANMQIGYLFNTTAGFLTQVTTLPSNPTPGQWVRVSITTTTTPANIISMSGWIGAADNVPIGTTFDVDAAMLTEGSSAHAYADGDSTNWVWSGAQHNSTSYGPRS